jgi:hypothetical protein
MITPLAVAIAGYALIRNRRKQRTARRAVRDDFASDPRDPVQGFDEASELQVMPLDVDALSHEDVEAAQDLAGLESELDERSIVELEALDGLQVIDERTGAQLELDRMHVIDETAIAEPDGVDDVIGLVQPARPRDAGELYGVHTPPALDRDHPDDDRAFDEGQNWVEALETSAIEYGPEPERTLDDIVDDEDMLSPPHSSDVRDRPVADHGSGGRRGL